MRLRSIPAEERPRERLKKYGSQALSVTELLAIVLSTGTKGKSVLELAQEILVKFGSLQSLVDASLEELMEIRGLGKAKAIQLKAAFGIATRWQQEGFSISSKISAKEAYHLVKGILSHKKQESLVVVLKDVKEKFIAYETISVGTLSQVLVHPREVFFPAVRHKASSFILVHNHPSGDPTPSTADLDVTRHLLHSSKVMGIRMDDHIIVGRDSFISLKEAGFLSVK